MENSKKKSRFNIIDAFVLLLIAALIFGIVYFILIQTGTLEKETNEQNIVYTIRISEADKKYADYILAGTEAYNSSTFTSIGTITEVTSQSSVFYGNDAVRNGDGYAIRAAEYDGKQDIYITISAKAEIDTRGIAYIGSNRITVGSQIYFRNGNFAASGFITDFTLIP